MTTMILQTEVALSLIKKSLVPQENHRRLHSPNDDDLFSYETTIVFTKDPK